MKRLTVIISAIIALCAAAGANAAKLCLGTPTVWASGISVNPASGTLNPGGTATVTATVAPSDTTNAVVAWSSSNTAVATVSGGGANNASGSVTANAVGTATITATTTDGTDHSATYSLTVSPLLVSSISISGGSTSIDVGSSTTWSATVSPSNATNQNITWSVASGSGVTIISSSNTSATIRGDVEGSATIRATAQDAGGQYGSRAITINTPYHPNLSGVCSNNLIQNGCNTYSSDDNAQTFEAGSCPSPSPSTIYGNSRCSLQNDPGYGLANSNFRPVSWTPTNNLSNGWYCWCQICNSSARTTCGAWVLQVNTAEICSSCAFLCAGWGLYVTTANYKAERAALCASP